MSTQAKILHGSVITILAVISITLILTRPHRAEAPQADVGDTNPPSETLQEQLPPELPSAIPSQATSGLADTKWTFVESIFDGYTFTPKTSGVFTLSFLSDGTVSIHTDCNSMGGAYTVHDSSLTFGALMSTLMYCEGSQEGEFGTILGQVHRFEVNGDTLMLYFNKSGVATFTKGTPTSSQTPIEVPDTPSQTTGGCFVGGCSSQLCTDDPSVVSTCEWRDEYACYKDAVCERQPTGKCGWTETPELKACLNTPQEPVSTSGQPRPLYYAQ